MAITNINGVPYLEDYDPDKPLGKQLYEWGERFGTSTGNKTQTSGTTRNYFAQSPNRNKRLSVDEIVKAGLYRKTYDQDNTRVYMVNSKLRFNNERAFTLPEVLIKAKALEDRFIKEFEGFELILFANSDGAVILQHFEYATPKPNQLILFLEINDKSNYFGSVMRVKLGERIITSKLPFTQIYEFSEAHQVKISKDEIIDLINDGNLKNKFRYILRVLNKISNPVSYISGIAFSKMGDVFKNTIPDFLEELKIAENRWNPEARGYYPLFGSRGLELLVQQSIRAKVKPDNHFKLVQKTIDDMFDKIESRIDAFYKFITQYFPNTLNRKFHTILKTLNTKLKDARKVFNDSDWLSKLLALGTQMFNAYLCGIINGFIDAINGVFQLIGLVCYAIAALNKGASDILFAASMLVEVFENIFEAIIEFDLIGFLWKCVKLPFKFVVGVYKLLKQITETDLKKLLKKLDTSLVKIAYVCGNIVGFIIQLLLEALCTGGVAAVEDLIQTLFKFLRNPAESIANGIKATINISKEFFYNLIYKLSKFFESLKSKAAFKAIDEWVEQLLAAIKKELGISDEVLDDIAPLSPKKKVYDDFLKKYKGKPIGSIKIEKILDAMVGHTEQANKIVTAIKERKMILNILEDAEFEELLINYYKKNNKLNNEALERIRFTQAFTFDGQTYYKASKPIDGFMSELVHEGTHVLDILKAEELYKAGKTEDEILQILGDNHSFEKRAYFYERQFQQSTGTSKDFETIEEMLKHILTYYDKEF